MLNTSLLIDALEFTRQIDMFSPFDVIVCKYTGEFLALRDVGLEIGGIVESDDGKTITVRS
jgi:hypothetical protein